jgi:hypothetical protein
LFILCETETTKRVIKYLAETTPETVAGTGSIEMQIMSASPILEVNQSLDCCGAAQVSSKGNSDQTNISAHKKKLKKFNYFFFFVVVFLLSAPVKTKGLEQKTFKEIEYYHFWIFGKGENVLGR